MGADLRSVMDVYKLMGFSGAFGSEDCTYINWRRCPVSFLIFVLERKRLLLYLFLAS